MNEFLRMLDESQEHKHKFFSKKKLKQMILLILLSHK